MESSTISESTINGTQVSFFCVSGTPVGEIYIVACSGENKFFGNQTEAKALYVKKAKALLLQKFAI